MGLFGWLFNWKRIAKSGVERPGSAPADCFVDLPSHRFFGPSSESPDRRYKIAWNEGQSTEGGAQTRKRGQYLLLDREKVIADGNLAHPIDGAVANNGNFIIIDAKQTAELSGSLHAFDAHGRRIFVRTFKANIFNCGISPDGRFAACQTCNSDDENDSGILAIFDLFGARELSTWTAESGWPTEYAFSPDGGTIGLGYRDLGTFRYSLSGDFIDREKWQDACLTKGDYGTAILMAEALAKNVGSKMSPELSSRIIACIQRITPQLAKADRQWQALALKVHGACLEASGMPQDALTCYDKALALYPKIGVKRRADQLRKNLARASG